MTILKSANSASSSVRIVSPYELTRTLTVKKPDEGKSVLDFFLARFPYIPREKWMSRIENGWIYSDKHVLGADSLLKSQQVVHHFSPRVVEPAVPDEVKIIKKTEDWLAVYKPAPMPMHQGGRYNKNTLVHILSEMGYPEVKIVHRLDAVTSGLVILARNKPTALAMTRLFSENRVKKIYRAVVEGEFPDKPFEVNAPIRRKNGFVFECGHDLRNTKKAITQFTLEKREEGLSLVRCIPVTGRTHQIRLHLQYAGFPVLDDPIYGKDGDQTGRKLQNSAIQLQSSGIEIDEMGIRVSF